MRASPALALALALALAAAAARGASARLNTKSRGVVRGAINVHIVPHSHDDVGWLKTVDQYATGSNNSIQFTNVNLEIDTVLSSLLANPDRKFMFVEQAFFQRWVESASPEKFELMQQVVASGQMIFVNGGWCMHDESSPTYVDMIDQTVLGHRLIKQQFNVVPSTTWQIDPFGHSSTQASLLSSELAGFAGLFFGRIDYQDRAVRTLTTNLEHIWRGSASTGASSQTFTDAIPGYGPPPGLCYDQAGCGSTEPWNDDPSLEEYNIPAYVNYTVDLAYTYSLMYKREGDGTVNIMWTMGSDFQYVNAEHWYKNLDKMIAYVNANTSTHGVNLLYSNPEIYTESKLSAANLTWTVKTDDYFPWVRRACARSGRASRPAASASFTAPCNPSLSAVTAMARTRAGQVRVCSQRRRRARRHNAAPASARARKG